MMKEQGFQYPALSLTQYLKVFFGNFSQLRTPTAIKENLLIAKNNKIYRDKIQVFCSLNQVSSHWAAMQLILLKFNPKMEVRWLPN